MKDNKTFKLSEFESGKMNNENDAIKFEINELQCEDENIEESSQENSLNSSLEFN